MSHDDLQHTLSPTHTQINLYVMVESNRAECNTELLSGCQTGDGCLDLGVLCWSSSGVEWHSLPRTHGLNFGFSSVRPGPSHETQTC